jgi:hypothetical protein
MIQRIQTVYLLVVAILMVVMMSVPVGSFYTDTYIEKDLAINEEIDKLRCKPAASPVGGWSHRWSVAYCP